MTSERIIPYRVGEWKDRNSYLIYLRHLAAYYFARSIAMNRRVLDLGCGVGYGTAIIAETAKEVIGLDLAPQAVSVPPGKGATITIIGGDSTRLPLSDETFDLIVSFQVIEHIAGEVSYLKEIWRLLVPGGQFIVSTPNRALRLLPFQPPLNPYHVREYNYRSLKKALTRQFDDIDIRGLQCTPEIMAIEHERLRQNPFKAYSGLIAAKILPLEVQKSISNFVRSLRSNRPPFANIRTEVNQISSPLPLEKIYSVDDFWIDTPQVKKSLDFIGICHKRRQGK